MIIGNIKTINHRSNNNKSIQVMLNSITYANLSCLGDTVDIPKTTVLTGDCLELDCKFSNNAFRFKVYVEQNGMYHLVKNAMLIVDFSINVSGDILYYEKVKLKDYIKIQGVSGIHSHNKKYASCQDAMNIIKPLKLKSKAAYMAYVSANPHLNLPMHPEVLYS